MSQENPEHTAQALHDAHLEAIRALGATYEGRALLWHLLSIAKFAQQPFTADPQTTAFQCGEQNIGIQVFGLIAEANPTLYFKMAEESQK